MSDAYNSLRLVVDDFIVREGNFKKSPNHPFQISFLIESRKETVRRKVKGLRLADVLFSSTLTDQQFEKVEAKRQLILTLSERIFDFIRARVLRPRYGPSESDRYNCEIFEDFIDNFHRDGMANFEYKEAKHLPELKEVKTNTAIRDFLAAVRAYHDILSAEGKTQLISFVINAKILGTAKTKLGEDVGVATLAALKALLHERCGSKETYESLREKLANVQLKGRALEAMADEIGEITDRLAAIEIQRQGAGTAEAVRSMMKRDALLAFKKRVPERLKLVVEAARPASIEEALAVASAASAGADKDEEQLLWGAPRTQRPRRPERNGQRGKLMDKSKVTCYGCGQMGHYKNECRSEKRDTERTRKSGQDRFKKTKKRFYMVEESETSSGSEAEDSAKAGPSRKADEKGGF
jgi:Zinc knuckle